MGGGGGGGSLGDVMGAGERALGGGQQNAQDNADAANSGQSNLANKQAQWGQEDRDWYNTNVRPGVTAEITRTQDPNFVSGQRTLGSNRASADYAQSEAGLDAARNRSAARMGLNPADALNATSSDQVRRIAARTGSVNTAANNAELTARAQQAAALGTGSGAAAQSNAELNSASSGYGSVANREQQVSDNQTNRSGISRALGGFGFGAADGGPIEEKGADQADTVPALVDGVQPARLNHGEHVIDAPTKGWYGEKFFHKLKEKADKERAEARRVSPGNTAAPTHEIIRPTSRTQKYAVGGSVQPTPQASAIGAFARNWYANQGQPAPATVAPSQRFAVGGPVYRKMAAGGPAKGFARIQKLRPGESHYAYGGEVGPASSGPKKAIWGPMAALQNGKAQLGTGGGAAGAAGSAAGGDAGAMAGGEEAAGLAAFAAAKGGPIRRPIRKMPIPPQGTGSAQTGMVTAGDTTMDLGGADQPGIPGQAQTQMMMAKKGGVRRMAKMAKGGPVLQDEPWPWGDNGQPDSEIQKKTSFGNKPKAMAQGGPIDAAQRNALPKSSFGLPGERKYPVNNRAHAINAKARATQQVKVGNLSPSVKAQIDAKANRVLGVRRMARGGPIQHYADGGATPDQIDPAAAALIQQRMKDAAAQGTTATGDVGKTIKKGIDWLLNAHSNDPTTDPNVDPGAPLPGIDPATQASNAQITGATPGAPGASRYGSMPRRIATARGEDSPGPGVAPESLPSPAVAAQAAPDEAESANEPVAEEAGEKAMPVSATTTGPAAAPSSASTAQAAPAAPPAAKEAAFKVPWYAYLLGPKLFPMYLGAKRLEFDAEHEKAVNANLNADLKAKNLDHGVRANVAENGALASALLFASQGNLAEANRAVQDDSLKDIREKYGLSGVKMENGNAVFTKQDGSTVEIGGNKWVANEAQRNAFIDIVGKSANDLVAGQMAREEGKHTKEMVGNMLSLGRARAEYYSGRASGFGRGNQPAGDYVPWERLTVPQQGAESKTTNAEIQRQLLQLDLLKRPTPESQQWITAAQSLAAYIRQNPQHIPGRRYDQGTATREAISFVKWAQKAKGATPVGIERAWEMLKSQEERGGKTAGAPQTPAQQADQMARNSLGKKTVQRIQPTTRG